MSDFRRHAGRSSDVEDDEGDQEADDRIGEVAPDCDDGGACEHAQADEAVNASVPPSATSAGLWEPVAITQPHLCAWMSDDR